VKGCVAFSRDSTAEFAKFAEQHELKPVIAKEFAFQDAKEAFQALTDQSVVKISEE
jgi:D-arabinose 1-dehydrogenase-like Zn-dependent alcohol dehydrogenase